MKMSGIPLLIGCGLWTRVQAVWEVGPGRLQRVEAPPALEAEPRTMEESGVSSNSNGLLFQTSGWRWGIQVRKGGRPELLRRPRVEEVRQSGLYPALPTGNF